jgi:LysM repeat protein
VRLDRIFVEDDLGVEGTIDVELVYMSADDQSPIKSFLQSVPFTQHLEVKGIQAGSNIHVRPQTEQLSTVMLSGTEVEVRAALDLDTLVCDGREEQIITEITERPFDEAVLSAMPGMIGYIVKEGDTLWSIAKRFYTSIDRLRRYNSLTGDNVRPGEKLLIVKEGQL